MLQQFSSFRGDTESVCRSSCISHVGKSNSIVIQGENAGLGSQAHNLQVNKAPDGPLQQLWKRRMGHVVWEIPDHPTDHSHRLHPPASGQSYRYPTRTNSSLWVKGGEPYKGTGPRHKHLRATRTNSTSLREPVYC